MIYYFQIAALSLFIYIIIHWLFIKSSGPKFFMVKSLLLHLIGSIIFLILFLDKTITQLSYLLLLFVGLCNAYIIFLINLQNSISFRILKEFIEVKKDILSYEELNLLYPSNKIIIDRLNELIDNKFIFMQNEKIILTKKGYLFGKSIKAFQKIFGIEKSG